MLIQALTAYADIHLADEVADPLFAEEPVPWLIQIQSDGAFVGLVPTEGRIITRGKSKKTEPKRYRIPAPGNRADYSTPGLAVDAVPYVLGPGLWSKPSGKESDEKLHEREEKERRHHRAFQQLIQEAAEATGDDGLRAAAAFYASGGAEAARQELHRRIEAKEVKVASNSRFALVLAGDSAVPIFGRTVVRDYWRNNGPVKYAIEDGRMIRRPRSSQHPQSSADDGAEGNVSTCLACGNKARSAATHNQVKGIPGGNPQVVLASFDKAAFLSHGWEQAGNSPVCGPCMVKYTQALQRLLDPDARPRTCLKSGYGDVAFVFWTRRPTGFDFATLLDQPDSGEVAALLDAARRGGGTPDVDAETFYAVALSGNGARIVVRSWIETTVSEAKRLLARWFEDLDVVRSDDSRLPGLRGLLEAAGRRDSKGKLVVPPSFAPALARAAIQGAPVPMQILSAALARIRAEVGDDNAYPFNANRMGLIRATLNRSRKENDPMMKPGLSNEESDPAYACGRLLKILGRAQYLASAVETGVVERFYGTASTAPRLVFPRLLKLNRHHLAKLDGGTATNIEKDIEAQTCHLQTFPALLSLPEQGRFALGFYHQQAEYRQRSEDRKRADAETASSTTK